MNTVAIVGGRNFTNYDIFLQKISEWISQYGSIQKIISGGAKGADTLAERYALEHNIVIVILKPEWEKFGRGAGLKRNTDILNQLNGLDNIYVIAFPTKESRGTYDTINKARSRNIPVTVFDV